VFTVQPTRYAARDLELASTLNTSTIAAAAPIIVSASNSNAGTVTMASFDRIMMSAPSLLGRRPAQQRPSDRLPVGLV
jgi:hypothetical protein